MTQPRRPAPVHLLGPKPPAYRWYAGAWAGLGGALAVAALPDIRRLPWPGYALFLVLAAAGAFIIVRYASGYISMQAPVMLAATWLFGWPAAVPMAATALVLLWLTRRVGIWVALVAFGNMVASFALGGTIYHALSPPPHAGGASWAQAGALAVAGAACTLANSAIALAGRFLDSGDPQHIHPRHVAHVAGFIFLAFVPVSYVIALASSVGASAQLLTVAIWLLTSFALKGMTEAREANARLEEALAEVRHLSVTDPLTGLHNRRHFIEVFERELARHRAVGAPLSLLLLDLRGLKAINDTYGHPRGDAVLCHTAGVLRNALAPDGLAFRIGGDEFALLLPGTGREGAVALGERLCAALEGSSADLADGTGIGATGGVAVFPEHGESTSQLISAADAALYAARARGAAVEAALVPRAAPPPSPDPAPVPS